VIDIDDLEAKLLGEPEFDCPVTHRFGPGVYIREVLMPKGAYIIGHRHKTTHVNIMLTGVLGLLNDDGTETLMRAPQTFVAQPGRKMAFIYEDVIWQNVHATDETDVEKLEEMFLDMTPAFLEHHRPKMTNQSDDVDDFHAATADVDQLALREAFDVEPIPFPAGDYKVQTAPSPIEGKGLFATAAFAPNELIAPARLDGRWTLAGRYMNHAKTPNAELFEDNGDLYLFATKEIGGKKGGGLGEEITIDYRQVLTLAKRRS